ncbi:MAG: hypothetical protein ACP5NV_05005 [Candidatus Woesearchaeota archaeon]
MMEKRGQGQSWSLDIILAFVIFMLIVGIFYTLLSDNKKTGIADIQLEASTLSGNLDGSSGVNSSLKIINDGTVDGEKLKELYSSNYGNLKSQFGLRGNFCIYMVDQYGNLLAINTSSGIKNGFGDGKLLINGEPCGTVLS